MYSCNHSAQFFEVENLSPSKFKNSAAGTLSGKIYPPWSFKIIGKIIAERAIKKNVTEVAFDRSGFNYHGRIKALAESAREHGLKF